MERREWILTGSVLAAGLALLAAAIATGPRAVSPELFSDQGEALFPGFKDPTDAASIEVTSFDQKSAAARPFKVERQQGRWVIPSHENYPAEAEKRLVETAARLKNLKKDSLRSDRVEDHKPFGVVDPLAPGLADPAGVGSHVTLRDEKQQVMAELIVGDKLKDREGYRYVRLPGQKRTYAVKMDVDLSGEFKDWIEPDLLKLDSWTLKKVEIDDYSIRLSEDKKSLQIVPKGVLVMDKPETGDWKLEGLNPDEELIKDKFDGLTRAVDDLKIVDVLRKPPFLSRELKRIEEEQKINPATIQELQSKGFFIAGDGRLVSNEGELRVWTDKGVRYVLRFGELASGGGAEGEERRYLFLSADFDASVLGPEPTDETKKKDYESKVEEGKKKAQELGDRFADWYYVIPGAEFKKVRLTRADLVRLNIKLWELKREDVAQIKIARPEWGLEVALAKQADAWQATLGPGFPPAKPKQFWVDDVLADASTTAARGVVDKPDLTACELTDEKAIRVTIGDQEFRLGKEEGEDRYLQHGEKVYKVAATKVRPLTRPLPEIVELKLFDWKAADVESLTIHTPEREVTLTQSQAADAAAKLAALEARDLKPLGKIEDAALTEAKTWIEVKLPAGKTPQDKPLRLTVGGAPADAADARHVAFNDRTPVAIVSFAALEPILKAAPPASDGEPPKENPK
jgi:hypothetical protein